MPIQNGQKKLKEPPENKAQAGITLSTGAGTKVVEAH